MSRSIIGCYSPRLWVSCNSFACLWVSCLFARRSFFISGGRRFGSVLGAAQPILCTCRLLRLITGFGGGYGGLPVLLITGSGLAATLLIPFKLPRRFS
ncbi:hypothetical protein CDO30_31755 (plasmid) [Sinorhizobium meliloti]|uniref:Uncharacterized protein n=1 Tax=Rhizobium meliloti (strain 1021) TaxID=266834 RepID=Q92UC7_RHIME|nr:Hypothetical protein SM2011_b20909 [Sinorhizobium meliloti 2011]ASP62730.1 hypothetical protein CDO30_31755 [Sinorhizobium meliloti]CAC49607.1 HYPOTHETICAL PROTEIN SM_b20909 [Sinorhizobium meliloti 1021]PTD29819.1 hypothetical protein C5N13_06285 [Sinorhizobium meliloti]RVL49690.1 hypothetical protein CN146_01125 [Sinorhizobium meliloti]